MLFLIQTFLVYGYGKTRVTSYELQAKKGELKFISEFSNLRVTNSNPQVTRANLRVKSSYPQVTRSNPQVTSSNPRVTTSNLQVTSPNPRVTSSNT